LYPGSREREKMTACNCGDGGEIIEEEHMLICSSCGTVVEDSALIHRKYFNRASVATSRHQNIANVPLRLRSEPNAVHKETRERKAATSAEARSQKRARAHAAELEAEAGRAARDRERAAEEEKALASRRRELAAWQEERFRAKAMAARQLVAAQVSANAAQAAKVAAVAAERAKAEAAAAEVSPEMDRSQGRHVGAGIAAQGGGPPTKSSLSRGAFTADFAGSDAERSKRIRRPCRPMSR
jgi:hypothetical protein